MTVKRDYIMDHAGADSWEDVITEFQNKTVQQIKAILDDMFLHDDNAKLAEAIHEELS